MTMVQLLKVFSNAKEAMTSFRKDSVPLEKKATNPTRSSEGSSGATDFSASGASSVGLLEQSPKRKHRHKSKRKSKVPSKSAPVQTAEALVAQWNDPNINEDDFIQLYVDPEKQCQFLEDGFHKFTPRQVAQAAIMFRKSFPNLQFTYDSIEVVGNKVTIEGFMCTGTHTGALFSMLPGIYPAIPTTGKHCINDEEQLCMELDEDGKIN